MRALLALLVSLPLGGCSLIDALGGKPVGDDPDAAVPDAMPVDCDAQKCREIAGEFVSEPVRDVDILFVIDNSGSMEAEQIALATSFQYLPDVLGQLPGGLPNLHIGVISTDLGIDPFTTFGCAIGGDGGVLQRTPRVSGCMPPGPEPYIIDEEDPAGGRRRNYTAPLAETFACIATLGTTGCGFEQTLESMHRALDPSFIPNQGFLRPGAYLAVIFVTDEDDCSVSDGTMFDPSQTEITDELGPFSSFRCSEYGVTCDGMTLARMPATYTSCEPAESAYMHHSSVYADFLRNLKPPGMVFVSAITGPTTPFAVVPDPMNGHPELGFSCGMKGEMAQAVPAVRITDVVDRFQGRSTISSICNEDFTPAIAQMAEVLTATVSGNCLFGLLLDVAIDPGLQPDCKVYDVVARGTPDEIRTELPECGTPELRPCYRLAVNETECPFSPEHLSCDIHRDVPADPGTVVVVECYRP